jgi:Uncharacterized conserved protein
MIERFSQAFTIDQLVQRFSIDKPEVFEPNYNASPSQLIPLITHDSPQGLSYFYWGLAPKWLKNKNVAEKIVNVRSEQIPEKPVMIKSLLKNRCLVPMDGFYCWKRVGKKTSIPWRFASKAKEIFSFAGFWEEYEDEGEIFHTFTMITKASVSLVAEVTERMPLILNAESEKVWLNKESTKEELLAVLTKESKIVLDGYSVSPQLNDLTFNKPSLLFPTPPADQFGNLTLFN